MGQPGQLVTIAGKGFGPSSDRVLFGSTAASIQSWSDTAIVFQVPSIANGIYQVQVKNISGTAANPIQFTALTAPLIPVTFTVANATPTSFGDYIFLTGSTIELGNWGTTFDTAIGPMLAPKIAADGTVTWENGMNHQYTVPTSRTGFVNVNWQN
jgi:hypothetical protein